jgi:GNAT superfamily N-acetyltransferase
MPPVSDPAEIRAILHTDTAWSVYALGDLAPAHFALATWLRSGGDPPALLMFYRGFAPGVLFAIGEAAHVQGLLDELRYDGDFELHIRPEILPLLRDRYDFPDLIPAWRMVLPAGGYRPAPVGDGVRLGPDDVPALERLYADGRATGESPHFFLPSMVAEGVFFGTHEGGELTAAAGTHFVLPREDVAAIGNVYTRRDCRGRGLAGALTSAVVNELRRLGIATVILNVHGRNPAAQRVYERLGFVRHCDYYEGLAVRRREPPAPPAPSHGGSRP